MLHQGDRRRNDPGHRNVDASCRAFFCRLDVFVIVRHAADIAKAAPRRCVVHVQHLMLTNHCLHSLHRRRYLPDALRNLDNLHALRLQRCRKPLGDCAGQIRVKTNHAQIVVPRRLLDHRDHILIVDRVALAAAQEARADPVPIWCMIAPLTAADIVGGYPSIWQRDPLFQPALRRKEQHERG